jgi:hypothetical protein
VYKKIFKMSIFVFRMQVHVEIYERLDVHANIVAP